MTVDVVDAHRSRIYEEHIGVRLRRQALVNGAASRLRPSGFDP
jgi:hypothetical protein